MYVAKLPSLSLFVCLSVFNVFSSSGQDTSAYQLFLKNGTVLPEPNISEKLNQVSNLRTSHADKKSLVIIQFESIPGEAEKVLLKKAGIELLDYIPNKAYTATVQANYDIAILTSVHARSIVALSPEQKMQTTLTYGIIPPHAEKVKGKADLWLNFPKSFSLEEVKKELLEKGFEILSENLKGYGILEIRVPKTSLKELANLPFVQYLQAIPGEQKSLNDRSTTNSRANILSAVSPVGFNLRGEGVVIGVGDNADPDQHVDLGGRVMNHSGIKGGSHGVHIMGSIGGAGIMDERYKGYAPKSRIVAQINSNIWYYAPTYVQDYGMVITNNSYGTEVSSCSDFGEYTLLSSLLDQQAFDMPYLQHVFAAGNSGLINLCLGLPLNFGNILSGYTTAKNVISVGDATETGLLDIISSKGPTKDGRTKPDIAAQGTNIVSTIPGDRYTDGTGTSMAAASVSGGLALLYQRYRELHNQNNPQNALMKAILCNGADDKGLTGPDYSFGFGGMNLLRSLKMLDRNALFESEISNGGNNIHNITVPANTAQLKVMLYWNDPASSVLTGKALVNNLDLRVNAPDASNLLPALPDPKNVLAAAKKGIDDLNNMEQIIIDNPVEGNYTLSVNGKTIPQGSQKYVIVYDNIPVSTTITYPAGKEHLVKNEDIFINWDSYGNNTKKFKIDYSLNNGASWTSIDNAVDADQRQIKWTVPNITSSQAKVRITQEDTGLSSESVAFTILGQPDLSLSPVQCEGYIAVQWSAVAGATDYEVMKLEGDEMKFVAYTTSTNYMLNGLSRDSTYYVSVRARINENPGRRALAVSRTPNDGNCSGSISDNDLKLESIISPAKSGRLHTSSELSASSPVTIRVKNLDNQVSDQSIQLGYSIGDNGSAINWESVTPNIQPGGTYDHTFTAKANLQNIGSYRINVFVKKTGDAVERNNSITQVFKQLDNTPVVLPFSEQFENLPVQEATFKTAGLIGADRFDLTSSTSTGRLRTFVSSGMAYSGSKALTLDVSKYTTPGNVNFLDATFNLAQYDTQKDDIRLSFWFNNHGQNYNDNDKVWIRGKDTDAWIAVDNLYVYHSSPGEGYKRSVIEVSKVLTSNNKQFSESFQIRWGQYGEKTTGNEYGGAGYSFDDLQITRETNDIQLVEIIQPVTANSVYGMQRISAVVKNNSPNQVYDIPIKMQINGGAVYSQTISYLNAGAKVTYTFPDPVNLSASGTYAVKVWTEKKWDGVPENDAVQINIFNTPTISSFPYLQNFETNEGDWQSGGTNSSWEYGTPNSEKIKKAASGTKAWKTKLNGHYNDSEKSYLYSPGFSLSGMTNPTLSFSLAMDLSKCQDKLCDYAFVEYSTDGANWKKLGVNGIGTNWYNMKPDANVWSIEDYTRWHVSTIPIPTGLNFVRFRFVLETDESNNREGIAIDDIHIYELKNQIYSSGPESSTIKQVNVTGTNWINFIENDKIIVSIMPNNQDLGNTVIQTYQNQNAVRNSNGQYYHDRNFTIKPTNTSISEYATVRLYFPDTETEKLISATGCTSCLKPSSAYELAVSKYTDSNVGIIDGNIANNLSGSWLLFPSSEVVKVPYDNGYYAEFKTKTFSEFWLAKDNIESKSALPVELIKFTAQKKDGIDASQDVLLQWTTASEKDFSHFEVEVASGDAEVRQNIFSKIGEVSGGSSGQYLFTDRPGGSFLTRYYRLKMVDIDGRFTYSAIRSVSFDTKISYKVYPNPSSGLFNVEFQSDKNSQVEVRVYDINGRLLDKRDVIPNGLIQRQEINLSHSDIKTGLYFLEITSGGVKQVLKVLKE